MTLTLGRVEQMSIGYETSQLLSRSAVVWCHQLLMRVWCQTPLLLVTRHQMLCPRIIIIIIISGGGDSSSTSSSSNSSVVVVVV